MNRHQSDPINDQPVAGQWQRRQPLPAPRSHCAVAVHQERIYAFGGGSDNFASRNSVWAYDPQADAWEPRADMPSLRSGAVAVTVEDQIYVMGGGFKQDNGRFRFLTDVQIYLPQQDRWEIGPDLLQPHDYPAVALADGGIFVFGGHHPDATEGGPKTDPGFAFCERFDLAQERWEEVAPLGQPRFALAGLAEGNDVLAMGGVAFSSEGFHNFTLIERYNAAQDRWTEDPRKLPWTAAGLGACWLGQDTYVFGGYSGDGIHAQAARRRPGEDAWQRLPAMPAPLAAMGEAVLDDTIYLIGGWADDGRTPQDCVFAFTPKAG